MKPIWMLTFVFVFAQNMAFGQIYSFEESKVHFFSDAPLEDIEANGKDVKGLLDVSKNQFSIKMAIKSFQFEKELMQEHFNENYMESTKYPNSTFKGNLEGSYDLAKDGEYNITAEGELEIHGVAQKRKIPVNIKVKDGKVSLISKFKVKIEDHKIEVPKMLFQKIAEEVEVTIESALKVKA
jgi:polyisoprenoid-binding protein YceI